MGCMQLLVLNQPENGNVTDLEDAIRRCVEAAPIRFVDALVLTKNVEGAIKFATISDIEQPDRAWRGLLANALFGSNTPGIAPWIIQKSSNQPAGICDLKEVQLLEIYDRIPRNSSSLLVLVEHIWMDELADELIAPGHLVATGWISPEFLLELGNTQPHRWPR